MPGMDIPLVTITFVWTDWRLGHVSEADMEASRQRLIAEGREHEYEPLIDGERIVVKHWYHIPRRGDHLTIEDDADTYVGIVRQVFWTLGDSGVRIEFGG